MNRTTPQKPRLEASAAYEAQHLMTADYLARLQDLLGDLPQPEAADWGHVGTLAHVNTQLAEVAAHLESAIRSC